MNRFVVAAGLAALALPGVASAQAVSSATVDLTGSVAPLCYFSATPTGTGLTNTGFVSGGAAAATVTVTNLVNPTTGAAQAWGATVTFTGFCNGMGTDVSAVSLNGGLRTAQTLTGHSATNFDARAEYDFSLQTPSMASAVAGAARGDNNDGAAGADGANTTASGANVGAFAGGVALVITGTPLQSLVAGSYADSVQITLTGQI